MMNDADEAVPAVPDKCDPTPGAGVERNPCTEPGTLPRCELCPRSPNYWRRSER
jgi:hypothetical protein